MFLYIGYPATEEYKVAEKAAQEAWSLGHTQDVKFFMPGEVPMDLGAQTYVEQMANALRHGDDIQPFTSNILAILKKRREAGIPWTEGEALQDSERFPWYFDADATENSSSSSSDDSSTSDNSSSSGDSPKRARNSKKRRITESDDEDDEEQESNNEDEDDEEQEQEQEDVISI